MSKYIDIEKLNESDIFSTSLFILYRISKIPEYSLISELPYLLDEDNMLKLITYYGGKTIKIPTLGEFKGTLKILLLYQGYKVEGKPWLESLRAAGYDITEARQAEKELKKFQDTLKKYNITRKNFYE